MPFAIQLQTIARQGERFPTEWSLSYEDEQNGGWQMPPSEDIRAESRAPVSTIDEAACLALRQ